MSIIGHLATRGTGGPGETSFCGIPSGMARDEVKRRRPYRLNANQGSQFRTLPVGFVAGTASVSVRIVSLGGQRRQKKINSTDKITVPTRSGPNKRVPILIMPQSRPNINLTNFLPLTYADHILTRP